MSEFYRSLRSWKLILQMLIRGPNNLGFDLSPDPVNNFGALVAIFDLADKSVFQEVWHCRRWSSAPGSARLVFLCKVWVCPSSGTLEGQRCYSKYDCRQGLDCSPSSSNPQSGVFTCKRSLFIGKRLEFCGEGVMDKFEFTKSGISWYPKYKKNIFKIKIL